MFLMFTDLGFQLLEVLCNDDHKENMLGCGEVWFTDLGFQLLEGLCNDDHKENMLGCGEVWS